MNETVDNSNAVVRPPIAWALAFLAGLGLEWLYPLPFVPPSISARWAGGLIFALAFVLAIWAIVTIRKSGSRIETNMPTTTIVRSGPYRVTRNPIYLGMLVGQIGLGVAFDTLWVLAMLAPLYLVLRYGVVGREEAYLERKFGDDYRHYKSRVRRWI